MKFKVFIYCFIVFLISQYFSSYSWNSPFLEDDFLWAGQARLISEGMPHNAIDGSFFRPFSHNYFWQIMYNLSGNDPFNYHLINGMFHGINTVFLYLITRKYSSEMIGLSASLLFAAHPSTHRAVWWISGITETSQAVGFLGVILIWINCLRRVTEDKKYSVYTTISLITRILLIIVFSFLAFSSKEAAIMLPLSMMLIILVEMNREQKLYNRLKLTGRFNFAILLIIAVASGYFTIRHIDSNSRQTLRKDYALSVSNIPGNIIKSMIWLSPVSSASGSMLPIRMILESHLDTINKVEYPVESNIFSKLNSNRTTNIRISVLKNSYIFYLVIFLTLVLTFLGYRYKIGKIALSILIPTIFIYLLLPEFKFRPMYLYLPAAGFSIITINGLKKILSIMIEKHLNLLDISRKKMDDRTIAVTLLISILILCANLRYASSEYRMYWMPVVKSVNYSVSNMIKSKEQNMPNNDNQETPSQFWDMWAERLYNR